MRMGVRLCRRTLRESLPRAVREARCASAETCYAGHQIKPNQTQTRPANECTCFMTNEGRHFNPSCKAHMPETRPAPGSDLQRLQRMYVSLYGNCETEKETLLDLLELMIEKVAELGEE